MKKYTQEEIQQLLDAQANETSALRKKGDAYINRLIAMKLVAEDPEWQANQKKGVRKRKKLYFDDPEWLARRSKNAAEANRDLRVRVMTPDGIIHGYVETCKHYNITKGALRDRMYYNPEQYYYCDENGKRIERRTISDTSNYKKAARKKYKRIMTPDGEFESLRHAREYYNKSGATIREKCQSTKLIHKDWYYIDED